MSRKTWRTVSDTTLQCGAAAWNFFRHYFSENLGKSHVRTCHGKFAQLAVSMTVLRDTSTGFMGLCLGNQTWAALLWPLTQLTDQPLRDSDFYCLDSEIESAAVEFHYFHYPENWQVVSYDVVVSDSQIVLECQRNETESLLKHFLREPSRVNQLPSKDLKMIHEKFSMPPAFGDRKMIEKMPVKDLMMSIIESAAECDEPYIKQLQELLIDKKQKQAQPATQAADKDDDDFGGVLDELVLFDMPAEDRGDFDAVAKAVERKNQSEWQAAQRKRKAESDEKKTKKKKDNKDDSGRPIADKKKQKKPRVAPATRKAARAFNARRRKGGGMMAIQDGLFVTWL